MAVKGEPKLTEEARTFVVQSLACFDTPATVVAAVKREFSFVISPQGVESYDPTKRAGRNLGEKWRTLFEESRKAFLETTVSIGISHRAVRLRALQRMADKAETMSNLQLAAQLHEQAAKEVGGAFTNHRVLSGPGGAPVQVNSITTSMTAKEAAEAYEDTLHGEG